MPIVSALGAMSSRGFGEFAQSSTSAKYIEDYFSTWLYTGNGSNQTIINGMQIGDGSIVSPQSNSALPTLDSNHSFTSVAYGNGIYVAVARYITPSYNTTAYATSTDGITWTQRSSLPNGYWIKVIFAQGKFWALGGYVSGWALSQLASSTDGISWTSVTVPFQYYDSRDLTYVNNQFFVVGATVSTAYRSTDGATWTTFTPYTDYESTWSWNSFTYGNGYYVISSPSSGTFSSTNLSSWTSSGAPTSTVAVTFLNSNFYAWNGAILQKSSNSTSGTWSTVFTGYISSMVSVGSNILAFDRTNKTVLVSSTGNSGTWTANATTMSVSPQDPVMASTGTGAVIISANSTTARYAGVISSFTPSIVGKGGLVWIKKRTGSSVLSHYLTDTARGLSNGYISTNSSNGSNPTQICNAFLSNGFGYNPVVNDTGDLIASWTWVKSPKFFDVVTYTGNGVAGRTIAHNLQSVPGAVIIKRTDAVESWASVWRRNNTTTFNGLSFDTTGQAAYLDFQGMWSSTTFTPDAIYNSSGVANNNVNGGTYVAYLFAHDAGGFGLDGTQNVISCGSYTGNGSATGPTVTLGYEPQWLLIKKATGAADNWMLIDNMRGFPVSSGQTAFVNPDTSSSESTFATLAEPNSTGFQVRTTDSTVNTNGATYIYMAIRRGPMKVPTDATTVFSPTIYTGDYNTTTPVTNMLPATDVWWNAARTIASSYFVMDRLRGWPWLNTPSTAAETNSPTWSQPTQTTLLPSAAWWGSSQSNVNYFFKRAPGFMDEVCYTGTGVARTVSHNLGVAPELMIFKSRNTNSTNWAVLSQMTSTTYSYGTLQTSNTFSTGKTYGPGGSPNFEELSAAPTASVINIASSAELNASGRTFVAYLFASCPGVSKVGTYTGTGATQTISCGFTGGARYVLIKRIDNTGDWWVWDTARGMVAGTDPRIPTNSASAETNANWVYTTTGGFQIVTSDATVNASGGTYLFLAIA